MSLLTIPERSQTPSRVGPAGIGAWAVFLACSWTWCIGMFLPILLIRDYGAWGFVVFAVPNVVGAAAMGWVLRSPDAASRLRERHAATVGAFSLVTLAFHAFWLAWLASLVPGWWSIAAVFAVPVAAVAMPLLPRAVDFWAAALVLAVSAAALAVLSRDAGDNPIPLPDGNPDALLWLAPVCAFGFALCPYLDPTFLRARRSTPGTAGPAAFTLGFGLLFTACIGLTLVYAPLFVDGAFVVGFATSLGVVLLLAHLTMQAAVTVGYHSRELRAPGGRIGVLAFGLAIGWLAGRSGQTLPWGIGWGETGYRLFMAFYGLVFPAYVWLCMIPTRDGHAGLSGSAGRRKRLVWLGAVGVAAPLFWMGFVERQEIYLAPGLLSVLLARLLVRPRRAA